MSARFPFDDLMLFTQHVGSAVRLGVPLHQTVELLAGEMMNRRFRKALAEVAGTLKTGETLHGALSKHPTVFPDYYLRVLRAGEEAGALPDTLEQLANVLQHNFVLSQKLKKAFAYPLVVLIFLTGLGLFYSGWVLPAVTSVYEEMLQNLKDLGAEMPYRPPLAGAVFYLPVLIAGILALIGILFFLARRFVRAGWCGLVFDRIDLNLPFLGVFTRYAVASRLTRSLAAFLKCKVPLPQALGYCADMIDNQAARKSILSAKETVERGETLGTAMLSESLFPPTMVWMLSAAEVKGDFVEALDRLSDFYSTKVETTSEWMVEILEPAMIVVVGVLFIVLAGTIFTPMTSIFNLFTAVSAVG